jgi:hypothetical protein
LTAEWAVSHEIAHSYFGRGIMPANGNAGWIDEALATYASRLGGQANPGGARPGSMADHSPYYVENDGTGYQQGLDFLTMLGESFERVEDPWLSFEKFLKFWVPLRMHQTVTTETLQLDLEKFSGQSMTAYFDRYVYGKGAIRFLSQKPERELKPMTREQLQRLQ